MGLNHLYMEVPLGALCCFLFLFFSFMNTPRTKPVRSMQLMLLSCVLWTGGDLFVRLQFWPGIRFWYNVSLFGLLMIPVCTYYFLFQTLEIQNTRFLILYSAVSCIGVALNAFLDIFITESKGNHESEIGYSMTYGAYVLIVLELAALVYVTVLAHKKIGTEYSWRTKLVPLLIGCCFIFMGNIMEAISENKVPYGSLGGVLMAVCVTHMIYRQYLFNISRRLLIGLLYTLALMFILLPIWYISAEIEQIIAAVSLPMEETLILLTCILAVWAFANIFVVMALARRLDQRQSEEQYEKLQAFQRETLSILSVEELCQKILEDLPRIIKNMNAFVVLRNHDTGEYEIIGSADRKFTKEELEEAAEKLEDATKRGYIGISALRYDNVLQGYLCLEPKEKLKMNYLDVRCFQQFAAHVSICLKNIHIYQKRYQLTIHDDLTGLFNRRYFKEYMEKNWKEGANQSFLYLDIDDFKLFNEMYGEDCGDDVLKWCGKVISSAVGRDGLVFRLGSNEYVVYLRNKTKNDLLSLSQEIQKGVVTEGGEKPKVLQPITMSIGIALYPSTASNYDELLKQAERATFFAKQGGKNSIEVYGTATEEKKEKVKKPGAYEQISSTIYALTAAINAKDSYTFDHSIHVSQYAVLLAKEIGLNSNEVQIIKEAGLLHDIGKIGIPEHILMKQGKLTDEEYEIMKTHVTRSVEMIHFLPNMNYVIPAVISHHERYDGRGYPRGLAGEEIPLQGRILAVCDCYDAMVSKRAYKEALSKEYAISELQKNKGLQFDPDLVDVFVTLIPHLERVIEEADQAV